MPRTRLFIATVLLAAVAAAAVAVSRPQPTRETPTVRLAVLVVFDQLRGDFVDQWRELFGPDGFRRVQDEGAWFVDCHFPYATTSTGPGHASLLTGATPDRHGIINNEWYDRMVGSEVYCAGSDRYEFVPLTSKKDTKPKPVGTPDRLLSPTVADVLKEATAGRSKVFGLSLKDRSAILTVGKQPDGAYWFTDKFITSTYYRDVVHPWVEAFNTSGAADRWRGKMWDRFRSDLNYEKYSGPPEALGGGAGVPQTRGGEKAVISQGTQFPHPMDAGLKEPGDAYYAALANSPFGNELLLEFAKTCIISEKLGQDDVPDLISISFASNDLIGHTWGPDSQEVLDVTLRSDQIMADLLKFLDERIGKGKYVLAITADHGICPTPEAAAAKGKDAQRISASAFKKKVEEYLAKTYPMTAGGQGSLIEKISGPWVYLNYRMIKAMELPPGEIMNSLANWLRNQPEIEAAFTRQELARYQPDESELTRRIKRSFHMNRSGDIYIVQKPYYLVTDYPTGTNHGTPHDYDTHVPLLVYGPGITGGVRTEPVTPQHIAPIFSYYLGIEPPPHAIYGIPTTLFGNKP